MLRFESLLKRYGEMLLKRYAKTLHRSFASTHFSSDDDSSDSDSVTSDDLATMSCERPGNAVFVGAGDEQGDNDKVFSNATTCSDIAQFDVADKRIPNGE